MAKYSISYIYEIVDKYTKPLKNIGNVTKNVRASIDKAAKSAEKFGKSMRDLGAKATLFATTPIMLLGKSMLKAASDAEETRSKYATIFKSIGSMAEQTADTFAQSYGLAGSKARELLGNTADMLTGFGFTAEEALKLSKRTNELAVDLASFTNYSGGAEGASAALTKALLGERESVKSLGVAILEEDVKKMVAILRSKGMRFNTMREAKAYATLQIAIDQSKNAIGDYDRTKSSYANTVRRVQQRLTNLSESFGKVLQPSAKSVLIVFEMLVENLNKLDDRTKKIILVVLTIVAAFGPLLLVLGGIVMLLPTLAAGLTALPWALTVAGIGSVFVAFGILVEKSDSMWQALKAAAAGTVLFIDEIFRRIGGLVIDTILSPIKAVINALNMIPGVKMPKGLTDVLYFSKLAGQQVKAKEEYYSGMFTFGNVAATSPANMNINGSIDVTASGGARVNSAVFTTNDRSNLGVNVVGAR